jgi:hypothetical protein
MARRTSYGRLDPVAVGAEAGRLLERLHRPPVEAPVGAEVQEAELLRAPPAHLNP